MNKQPIRLLIAEDEDSIRGSIENYVRNHTSVFSEVLGAATGQETLDLIYRCRPDVMLLDIQMPVKNGLTVLEEATAAGLCPKTIILSGHDSFKYAQQAIRYGVAEYLLKPVRSVELLQKLQALAPCEEKDFTPVPDETSTEHQIVELALKFMYEHYHEPITQPIVAQHLGITPNYLSTLFAHSSYKGFAECLNKIRVQRACNYFADNQMKAYEVAFRVGFHDEKYFSNVFKKIMGVRPSQYRRVGATKKRSNGNETNLHTLHNNVPHSG